ncbi:MULTISPECIES: ATP-binding protein [Parasutterella]|uniref:ATP-binding protein n=3 Tax=Sutterellaceae TaxID=995019 RepID=UPI0022E8E554|nr:MULTISPECIES: ATP-binding protein [Parasutterella]MBS5226190.1 ATP-binding protein [Parasutterella sp.]
MNLWKRLSKAEKKSEALKKINEADLLTIDDFGLRALIAQEQSLAYEIIKSHADNLSTIIVSQRPCADWYGWLGGKYITDGASDRIINFYYLIELKGESRRALGRKQARKQRGFVKLDGLSN